MDKLIVKGLGKRLDGEYEFDLAGMMTLGHAESLTNREGHRIKLMAGVTQGQMEDALIAGDNDVLVALAAILLNRAGKSFDEDILWDAPMGAGLNWEIEEREEVEDERPPESEPETEPPKRSGGPISLHETSESRENGLSPTGPPSSETLASVPASDQETLAS